MTSIWNFSEDEVRTLRTSRNSINYAYYPDKTSPFLFIQALLSNQDIIRNTKEVNELVSYYNALEAFNFQDYAYTNFQQYLSKISKYIGIGIAKTLRYNLTYMHEYIHSIKKKVDLFNVSFETERSVFLSEKEVEYTTLIKLALGDVDNRPHIIELINIVNKIISKRESQIYNLHIFNYTVRKYRRKEIDIEIMDMLITIVNKIKPSLINMDYEMNKDIYPTFVLKDNRIIQYNEKIKATKQIRQT